MTQTPPETSRPETLSSWQATAAALWIGLVTLAYLGTIAMERGDRIRKIVESIVSG